MNLVTQDSYERRHKQVTTPTALVKEKRLNKNQYRKLKHDKDKNAKRTKNNNHGGTAQTKNGCGQHHSIPRQKRRSLITATN